MMDKSLISHARLTELLLYNPDSGNFIWRIKPNRNIKIGSIAGTINCTTGYINIGLDKKIYLAHRLAIFYITHNWPVEVDHNNRIRNDNRWINLRDCTHKNNMWNKSKQANNTSGVTGVTWCKRTGKWLASFGVHGKRINLGYWDDIELAELIVTEGRKKYHGEFAA